MFCNRLNGKSRLNKHGQIYGCPNEHEKRDCSKVTECTARWPIVVCSEIVGKPQFNA